MWPHYAIDDVVWTERFVLSQQGVVMKALILAFTFLFSFSTLAFASDAAQNLQPNLKDIHQDFAAVVFDQSWRAEPDIFFTAAVQEAALNGLPTPKLPAECIEGLQCSNSRICVGGGCVNGRCEC